MNDTCTLVHYDRDARDLENYILLPVNGSGFVIIKQTLSLDARDLEGAR